RIKWSERLAQCRIEGIHRTIAFRHGVLRRSTEDDFDGGLALTPARFATASIGAVILLQFEERLVQPKRFSNEQFKGGFCCFELVSFTLQVLHRVKNLRDFRRAFLKFESELARLHEDVALPREIRDNGHS